MAHRARLGLVASALASSLALLPGCGSSSKPAPPPSVSSVTPAVGTVATLVSIAGANFAGSPTVTFTPTAGGAAVRAVVSSVTPSAIEAWVPAVPAAPGTAYGVTVTNADGQAAGVGNAFTMAAPLLTDVNGGLSGSGTVNSLFVLDGNNFGDLPTAPASGFSVDFRDTGTGTVVASAAVAFASGDWQNIFVVGTVPGTLAGSTTYDVTVTTPSGTTAARKFLVVAAVSFSPSTIAWASTAALPAARQGFPAVVAPISVDSGGTTVTTSYLYALGGNTASASTVDGKAANVPVVSYNPLSDSPGGSLAGASWTATAPLPAARGFAAAVSANGFNSLVPGNGNLYVLGGLDDTGAATSTVYYASLAADGSIPATGAGAWAATTPLPQALYAHGAVLFHGRIYVAGGSDAAGNPVAKVWSARINGDGTLAPWRPELDLPAALAHHQVVTAAGFLYALGGTTASVDPVSNAKSASSQTGVYHAQIDIRNGALKGTSWTADTASLGNGGREKFTAVVAGPYLLVSGGLYNGAGSGSSEQSYAPIGSDGSLGSFNGATGSQTITKTAGGYDFYNHAAAFYVDAGHLPHVLVLGGEDVSAGTPHAGVWYQFNN